MRTLWRLAAYVKPYPGLVVLLLAAMLVGIGTNLAQPRVFGAIIDQGIVGGSMPHVWFYTGLLALISLLRAAIHYGQGYAQERIGQEMIRQLRHDLFVRLQRLSFSYYTMHATGDQMSRLTSDVYSIMDFFGFGLGEMITSSLMFTGTVAMLLITDWRVALVVMTPIPVLMFFAFRFSGIVGPMWEKIRDEMAKLTTTLQENVSGVRVVKSFAREEHEMNKF